MEFLRQCHKTTVLLELVIERKLPLLANIGEHLLQGQKRHYHDV